MKPLTIAVIGGNAAGAAAAAKAKRVNPQARVVLFEKTDYISVGVCEFPFVLSGEISDPASLIFYTPEKFSEEKKVEVFIGSEVISVDTKERVLTFTDKNSSESIRMLYDRLIIATGSSQSEVAGLDAGLENVLWLKKYSDLLRTKDFLDHKSPGHGIVIGSGYLGLEIAEALVKRGMEVSIIEKESRVLPGAEPEFSGIIGEILREKQIAVYSGITTLSFITDNRSVKSVKVGSRVLESNALFPATGFRPDTRFIAGLDFRRGAFGEIITDTFLRTSIPYVYAAGDSAGIKNFLTSKSQVFYSAKVAHNTGHIAGSNAAGKPEQFKGAIPVTSFRIFDKYFSQTGLTEIAAREHGFVVKTAFAIMPNLVHIMPGVSNTAAKLIINKVNKQILGASFLGDKEVSGLSDLITFMIRNRMSYDIISETDFNYTPALSPFRNILISLKNKLDKG
ncbi:MAG: FAD-dependent oxidoreductase [Ignavibacteriaceae bacterium]|nr:FAD-dependent oxidoreductase [Ignavibacteriaceae bacterium]